MAQIHAATVRTNMIDEVVFLRHGRTAFNVARRLQGQIDVPLDIIGQWQADQSASELARRYYWAKVANIARHPGTLAQPGAGGGEIQRHRGIPAGPRILATHGRRLVRPVPRVADRARVRRVCWGWT